MGEDSVASAFRIPIDTRERRRGKSNLRRPARSRSRSRAVVAAIETNLAGERENERKEGVELPSPSAESEHNTVLAFASDNAANDEDIAATKDKKKVKSLSYLSKDAQT